jgi:deoxyadenosine/deoxycytidine kinase
MGKQLRILCEGNIAAGKSTFLNFFKEDDDFEILAEPMTLWKNLDGINLFEKYYAEPEKYFNVFQSYVFLTQYQQHKYLDKNKPIHLFERSIYSARNCFLALGKNYLTNEEHAVLYEWYKELVKEINDKVDLIIYIRATPCVSYERMKQRGRKEEKNVTLSTISQLHGYHENWLIKKLTICPAPVLIINANENLTYIKKEAGKIAKFLKGYLHSTIADHPHDVLPEDVEQGPHHQHDESHKDGDTGDSAGGHRAL